MTKLTQNVLKSLLDYEPATGLFIWKVMQGRAYPGNVAGSPGLGGYRYIKINKVLYRQNRLAWLYVHGQWPKKHIDHINGDTLNDRLCNLREASRSQNLANRKRNKNNASGFKGVSPYKGRYMANINKDGRRYYLGLFDAPEEAHAAYIKKATELFGEFARAA